MSPPRALHAHRASHALRVAVTLVAVPLAGCGSTAATTDAPVAADAAAACEATWSGNFGEVATAAAPCATLTGTVLALQAPSARLGGALPVSIDLGTAVAGSYSSDGVATWTASTTLTILTETCLYQAGSASAPHGDFTLALADTAPAAPHGMLALDQAVLATAFSTCGDPLTEHLELAF